MGLGLYECDRVTHASHGGESGHRDFGEGRVVYAEWWSQEGVYLDLIVADCGTGKALKTRTLEADISSRAPFDRTDAAMKIIETQMRASPVLFSLERLAGALKGTGRDIAVSTLTAEPCACAAVYPQMRSALLPNRGD
jgi:hypothetical protein